MVSLSGHIQFWRSKPGRSKPRPYDAQHKHGRWRESEEEYALFCLLLRDDLTRADRERVKLGSKELLKSLHDLLAPLEQWTRKEQTQAEVELFILDDLFQNFPEPPFTSDDKARAARKVYDFIWQQSENGWF